MKKIKPIKFRGKSLWANTLVYGDLRQDGEDKFITAFNSPIHHRVAPDSVAQFVGYDCNGEEIYSDDLILDEVFPGAVPQKYIAGDRVSVNSIGEKFDYFKLVKEGEK